MEAIYFLAGVVATILGLLLWKPDGEPRKKEGPQIYETIDTLTFTSEFKYEPPTTVSGQEVAMASAYALMATFEEKEEQQFFVKPGKYDVRLKLQATFIKRPE